MKSKRQVNLMLFGKTDAGKSTTINAFSNYCQFATFEQAEQGQLLNVIPSQIQLVNNDTDEWCTISVDQVDCNEQFNVIGQSVTQQSRS